MIEQIGGRKLAAVLVTLVLASVAVIVKGDVPPQFANLLEFLFAAFAAGNGVEHLAGAFSARATGTSPDASGADSSPVDLTPVLAKLEALEGHEANTQAAVSTVQQTLSFIIQKTGIGNKA